MSKRGERLLTALHAGAWAPLPDDSNLPGWELGYKEEPVGWVVRKVENGFEQYGLAEIGTDEVEELAELLTDEDLEAMEEECGLASRARNLQEKFKEDGR